jgi:hypothetical protein
LKTPTFLHGEVDDSGRPALRPAGHSASRNVQIRSRRICRTTEGVSQQIYSLPPLAAWVSLRIQFLKTPTFLHGEVDDSGHPALRPAGHSASRNVQIRSRRICRTTEDASWRLGRR